MRKCFLIHEEMRKYLTIYEEEAVSHIWLSNCSILNFLIYEENLILLFFCQCGAMKLVTTTINCVNNTLFFAFWHYSPSWDTGYTAISSLTFVMRSSLVRMRSSLLRMRSSLVRMRTSLVVRASDCQCTSCNGPGFDPSIRRHSGIWGAADEAVLNIVWTKRKKSPQKILRKKKTFVTAGRHPASFSDCPWGQQQDGIHTQSGVNHH